MAYIYCIHAGNVTEPPTTVQQQATTPSTQHPSTSTLEPPTTNTEQLTSTADLKLPTTGLLGTVTVTSHKDTTISSWHPTTSAGIQCHIYCKPTYNIIHCTVTITFEPA